MSNDRPIVEVLAPLVATELVNKNLIPAVTSPAIQRELDAYFKSTIGKQAFVDMMATTFDNKFDETVDDVLLPELNTEIQDRQLEYRRDPRTGRIRLVNTATGRYANNTGTNSNIASVRTTRSSSAQAEITSKTTFADLASFISPDSKPAAKRKSPPPQPEGADDETVAPDDETVAPANSPRRAKRARSVAGYVAQLESQYTQYARSCKTHQIQLQCMRQCYNKVRTQGRMDAITKSSVLSEMLTIFDKSCKFITGGLTKDDVKYIQDDTKKYDVKDQFQYSLASH